MNCAIIINSLSGNSEFVEEKNLIDLFGEDYDTTVIYIYEDTVLGDLSAFDRIVVCGGDGTLHSVINCNISQTAQLFYLPYGTFNESEHNVQSSPKLTELGLAGTRYFSYVCAAGIFTPLGYIVSNKNKKRWKKLAYFSKILQQYKVHRIPLKFEINGERHEGEYALVMAIDSPQCFGFKFNKMFAQDDGKLHFLAIKAPKHNGFLGAVELFRPLFRTFFVGFKKPFRSKNILFEPCKRVKMNLKNPVPFDMDGEKVDMQGRFDIRIAQCRYKLEIVSLSALQQLQSEQNGATVMQSIEGDAK